MKLSPIVAGLLRLPQWKLSTTGLVDWIGTALDLGITSFDHADIYGDYSVESMFGSALSTVPGLRDRLQIITKCGIKQVSAARPVHEMKSYDSSRAYVTLSVENSLRAFRTDHIDLLLMHRADLLMQPDELAETFRILQGQGKVLSFGVSNHSTSQLAMLHKRHGLVAQQIELSPLQMRALADGTLDQCMDLGLTPMIGSPLAGGRLFSAADAQAQAVRSVLHTLGRQHGVSAATLAYAWILKHPSRPRPITGSGRPEALREAVAALDVPLSSDDWYRIWQASSGHEVA